MLTSSDFPSAGRRRASVAPQFFIMSILDDICSAEVWREYLASRLARSRLNKREASELTSFIETEAYLPLAERVRSCGCCFAPPEKKLVNKLGSDKKRVVYSFAPDETQLLKLMAYLLYRYDGALADNLYSFRRDFGAKKALRRLTSLPGIDAMYCYKADIHDYFNSIDTSRLIAQLAPLLADDPAMLGFLSGLLLCDEAVYNGALISERRGAMAGMPISPFLANLYLSELDRHFYKLRVPYARYSDDIILFAPTRGELDSHIAYLSDTVSSLGLALNEKKVALTLPGEPWVFLGVEYAGGKLDLSPATKQKLKGKLSRQSRSIYRWKCRKGADAERAMRAFARAQARRFFDNPIASELTWTRWFFPLISSDAGLKELDGYIRQCMRYTATGNHSAANYRIPHEKLRELGLISLVNEYYRYRAVQKEKERQ